MREDFLTRTWCKHEDPTDRKTWGPTRLKIDWSGFDPDTPEVLGPGDET